MKRLFLSIMLMTASQMLWAQQQEEDNSEEIITEDVDIDCSIELVDPSSEVNLDIEVECGDDQIFFLVDEMPEFPEGELAMRKYFAENVRYPENVEPKENCTVFVRFVVDIDGKVTNPEIMRGVDVPFDEEALRVVGSMPDWTPGRLRGKAVRVAYTVPILFVAE